ncbi:MAG: 5-hydroxyisourate hydrolase [Thermoleophilaceae bacterium]|jgi:5-hydroxyisourate hydrolase|nr:5-hydroxyisourate hydrolase [Thermoleophilaceae bacterium]MEA2402453.1 5-hydroxyisourate hydrolase [Thermoleophilaceae bacterium]
MPNGYVTVHVLDSARGTNGDGLGLRLYRFEEGEWLPIKTVVTNDGGRLDEPLLSEEEYRPGLYELVFEAAPYFEHHDIARADPPYIAEIPLRLNFSDPDAHYHVPLALSPWGFTTFRGG